MVWVKVVSLVFKKINNLNFMIIEKELKTFRMIDEEMCLDKDDEDDEKTGLSEDEEDDEDDEDDEKTGLSEDKE